MIDPDHRDLIDAVHPSAVPARVHATSAIAQLLGDVERFVSRFVTFANEHQSTAVALWIVHVYAMAAAIAAAYLRITSAVEESGKTTLLEVLEQLLGGLCINLVSVSPAYVFRMRDKEGPVALLLDEIDNTLKDRKDDGARDLLALVNAGYRRSAKVGRTVGRSHESASFAAFGPAAIAGLGSLHPTTESRCVPIELPRKPRGSGERWIPFLVEGETAAIRERLAAWAIPEMLERLKAARPAIPTDLRDRHAEAWWSLFAIADVAGEPWATRARTAAIVLHADRDLSATASLSVLLLEHARRAFREAQTDRLSTADLLQALVENEEGPWGRFWGAEVNRDAPPRAAATDLAGKLRPFQIKPKVIRIGDETPRGYVLEDFEMAFALYLTPEPTVGDATDPTGATPLASTVARVASVAGGTGFAPTTRELLSLAGEMRWPAVDAASGRIGPGEFTWTSWAEAAPEGALTEALGALEVLEAAWGGR